MFAKILIANRGEIACRVARTAVRMGIRTVAVYSDVDADSAHVVAADEAVHIGGSAPRDSYLRADAVLEAARATGCEAIHPGYGFLSENTTFAGACENAGLCFIGPPAPAIQAMGLKDAALLRMAQAGVPTLPGFHQGKGAADSDLAAAADEIGYPLLVKPSAGGGGKGMRIVRQAGELSEALTGARREASAAFGDDTLMLERYLERPRHIEVQIFADQHGDTIYLLDRDCSIQRRYQKIIEEAPAPDLPEALRQAMGEAAVAAAKAIDYVGAGTVEFLVDAAKPLTATSGFYFMEMNTRLQVEHPVTEMILGVDLVEWQLRIANGEALPITQAEVTANGHAIEARLYAEDPDKDFLPSSGTVQRLDLPPVSAALRIDAGIRDGDEVSIHYDPMVAKLIVHGADRLAAVKLLRDALAQSLVFGLPTNLAFLTKVANDAQFARANLATSFIAERAEALRVDTGQQRQALALAMLWRALKTDEALRKAAATSAEPNSPWSALSTFRINLPRAENLRIENDRGEVSSCPSVRDDRGLVLTLAGEPCIVDGELHGEELHATIDGEAVRATAAVYGDSMTLVTASARSNWRILDPNVGENADLTGSRGELNAPMPATVIEVLVGVGDEVSEGQTLLVLEAMKMEHRIQAPFDAKVEVLDFKAGDLVDEGVELVGLTRRN